MLPWQPGFKYNRPKKLMQPFPKSDDMLPWQPEFKYNRPKKLMQPFPKPDDALNEIWLKLVLI